MLQTLERAKNGAFASVYNQFYQNARRYIIGPKIFADQSEEKDLSFEVLKLATWSLILQI
jgi:hypothetical protein